MGLGVIAALVVVAASTRAFATTTLSSDLNIGVPRLTTRQLKPLYQISLPHEFTSGDAESPSLLEDYRQNGAGSSLVRKTISLGRWTIDRRRDSEKEEMRRRQLLNRGQAHLRRQLQDSSSEGPDDYDGILAVSTDGNATGSEEDPIQQLCQLVEQQFNINTTTVRCTCQGRPFGVFSLTCEFQNEVCNEEEFTAVSASSSASQKRRRKTCGRPVIAFTLNGGSAFSAVACVNDYSEKIVPLGQASTNSNTSGASNSTTTVPLTNSSSNGGRRMETTTTIPDSSVTLPGAPSGTTTTVPDAVISYENTCVSLDVCEDPADGEFCGCEVTFDAQRCAACDICGEKGTGIQMDCSNINAEAVSEKCQSLDFDLDASNHQESFVTGFLPSFDGLCSRLEDSVTDRISCGCGNASGDTFDLTCETIDTECRTTGTNVTVCGDVVSVVSVVDSEISKVSSCVDFSEPMDLAQTCTDIEVCKDDGTKICSCSITYDGNECSSCAVCADGASIKVDCSTLVPGLVISECQPIDSQSSFEFIPMFEVLSKDRSINDDEDNENGDDGQNGNGHGENGGHGQVDSTEPNGNGSSTSDASALFAYTGICVTGVLMLARHLPSLF
jgi:hypothetical protein